MEIWLLSNIFVSDTVGEEFLLASIIRYKIFPNFVKRVQFFF